MGEVLLGGVLIQGDGSVRPGWGLAHHGGVIERVGPNDGVRTASPDYAVLDHSDKIISPGFVNAHMHSYGMLSRGIPVQNEIPDFRAFLYDFWWPGLEDRIDHQMIRATGRAAALELLNSGVTTYCDVLEAPHAIPGALDAHARAIEEIGIRAVLSFEATERVSRENGIAGLEENVRFIRSFAEHPLISGMMCFHTTFTCSPDFVRRAHEMAQGMRLQFHLSESVYEPEWCREHYGKLPVELYDEWGILSGQVLAAQGVVLSDEEIDILAERGCSLVHVPLSNCEVGGGFAPVPELLERGIVVGLGTDGYINNFIEVMRGAYLVHKASHRNPEVMSADSVWKMATIHGARALGLDSVGDLREGAAADFVVTRADLSTPVTADNAIAQYVLFRNPGDVIDVYVAGRRLKHNGELVGIDLERERAAVREQARRLWPAGSAE